jgi:hypothetical protein
MFVICSLPIIVAAEAFMEAGYAVAIKDLKGCSYGARTSRSRAWIVAINLKLTGLSFSEAKQLLDEMWGTILRLEIDMLDKSEYLLEADDQWLKDTIKGMIEIEESRKEAHDLSWRTKLEKACELRGIRNSNLQIPEQHRNSPSIKSLPTREKFGLAFTLSTKPDVTSIDVSQQIDRCFYGKDDVWSTFTPGAKVIDLNENRIITGMERLMAHGVPRSLLKYEELRAHQFSDWHLRDLAGNSFVGHVFLAVLIGVLAHWPSNCAELPEEQGMELELPLESILADSMDEELAEQRLLDDLLGRA